MNFQYIIYKKTSLYLPLKWLGLVLRIFTGIFALLDFYPVALDGFEH